MTFARYTVPKPPEAISRRKRKRRAWDGEGTNALPR
jgi:hypothetical protein